MSIQIFFYVKKICKLNQSTVSGSQFMVIIEKKIEVFKHLTFQLFGGPKVYSYSFTFNKKKDWMS